jgi:hypothetical protein
VDQWVGGAHEPFNQGTNRENLFYETLNELKRHLLLWLLAYNHQKKLKSLKYQHLMM